MVNCQPVDGHCTQCGNPVRGIKICPEGASGYLTRGPDPCPHLGEPTGAFALVGCSSCGGNVRKKHAVHACPLHGDCVPDFKGKEVDGWRGKVKDGRGCGACADNPTAKASTRTATR